MPEIISAQPRKDAMSQPDKPVAEWVGDFKTMAGLLAEIEDAAHHNNDTKDWSNRLCDAGFFAQRVAHVMLDLQPKYLGMLEALNVIANASQRSETMFGGKMSEVTRVFENITRVSRAAIAKSEGRQ